MTREYVVVVLLVAAIASLASAEIPAVISYQGKVTDTSGNPVADGPYTMRFRIYNASTGGSVLWDSANQSVPVTGGIFSVLLGESPQPAIALDFTTDYWLLVTFAGVNQSPRQRLASVGYAYMASGLVPGTEVSGAVASETYAAIKGTNTDTSGPTAGLFGESSSGSGAGVLGFNGAVTGSAYGVCGRSSSTGGVGVFGESNAIAGDPIGVHGQSSSTVGTGVKGWATATSGVTQGVYGVSASSGGRGVVGMASAATGTTYGGRFESASSSGRAVFGAATAPAGQTYGLWGQVSSTEGIAVYGNAIATTGQNYGVYGRTMSADGVAVFGAADAAGGGTKGVFGVSSSSWGTGVHGEALSGSGATYGGYFQSHSGAGMGVRGDASAGTGQTKGVFGMAYSSDGIGVFGSAASASGSTTGVYGVSHSSAGMGVDGMATAGAGQTFGGHFVTSSTEGYGVHGETASTSVSTLAPCGLRGKGGTAIRGESTISNGNGVVGIANGSAAYGVFGQSDTGYAGYFAGKVHVTGNFTVSGTKSFLIDHPLDPENRILAHACVESDQAVNMYRGTTILDERGEAVVELSEWFSALNTDYAYHLTPIGAPAPSLHVATKLEENRFRIGGGEPGMEVSWMVTAQRDDAWMRMHPFAAERAKAEHERGYYLAPEAYGQPPERGMTRAKETLPARRLAPPPEAYLGVRVATEASR